MNILITGVTAGFGRQIAIDCIKNGFTVIGTGRREHKLDELQSELGDNFIPLCFDVSDISATKAALEILPAELRQNIDVLINNAGLALGLDSADKASMSDWQTMINTNTLGLVNITHEILPNMVAKNDGLIINISSIAGNYPYFGGNVYGATKAFVTQFSLNLRADLIGKNVRITNIEPGLCGDTEFSNVRFHGDDERASKVYENVEFIRPQDISNMVSWLINQPKHININRLEVMPTAQTFAGLTVHKG
ncbi:malonic semialdehyde reductase [Moraxella bovoculi]|uniref:NADP-dependent L-serine/L-allo-threonine dehydrogenase n=1 Tax=Moraxella bovoculi 237 TaxID=743974 RepID=A0A066UDX6_9GAMM|nr:SDR family NAD(P)-dependent oxidoreductase [Moraxella bovoculi]AKG19114.1 malonic semialdehyde reductase [Moraxella bovoculi]KDN25596.1 NADP-dependent L-serine/L-allo-threonine dehydrogenase [Moraxella bovoculi 237]NSM11512.1 SDR family NAD(P)-dependent oxidoreductase [Moraxella bovoculi]